ncbi:hypothetical protein FQN52_000235 [Onygenales sp. PD_12]|nr:hypothetical protein FQN52_000235 [Onygenales sp. PD_12]KAK2802605.1 hypothetical protein FQN51_004398 [Onygenales sp. PD_10]
MAKQLSPKSYTTHLTTLLTRWPADPVRPSAVSVQTYLQSRLPKPTTSPNTTSPSNKTLSPSSINALYSLLENRYAKQYPLPEHVRHPRSMPDYYERVEREFREAPGRGWVGRVMEKVRGVLRFE